MVEVIRNPEVETIASIPLQLIWFIGFAYWLFCIHRLHRIISEATNEDYPITPGKASGFHFIPFYNIYWIFRWPSDLGDWLRKQRSSYTAIGGWLGLPMLGSFLAARLLDAARGVQRAATATFPEGESEHKSSGNAG